MILQRYKQSEVRKMKITIEGNSKERLRIKTDSNQENTEAIMFELKKTTQKLRRLFGKNGFEITLTLVSDNNLPEEG